MTTGLAVAGLACCSSRRDPIRASVRGVESALASWAGALALFVGLDDALRRWSDAGARAVEFNRTLLYLLMLVFFGLHAGPHGHLRLAALLAGSRWRSASELRRAARRACCRRRSPTKAGFNNARLKFPLTYWNAMGVFTALGVILAMHLTASEREPAGVRVAAAAALPVVAVALLLVLARRDRGGDRGHRRCI